MAIRHNFTILCENAITGQDGKLSLINIFQNVEVEQFPGGMTQMFIVTNFQGEPGEAFQVSIQPPGRRKPLRQIEGTIEDFKGEPRQYQQIATQLVIQVQAAVFPNPGVYQVILRVGTRVVHRHPFGVLKAERTSKEHYAPAR